jgi:Response regulator containing a CheY-like receiver domain and an HTH DNA-binding domain
MSRAPLKDKGTHAKATGLLREVAQIAQPTSGPPNIDTVRALCHDLRQPLAAIMLLARSEGGDIQHRMDGILDQAQWLSDMVEGVIGDAAEDLPTNVDVAELASRCVLLAQPTAACQVRFVGADRAMAVAAPVALSRAVNCVLDNAVRAAGHGGHVTVEVAGTDAEITIRVIDDGPGLGHVPPNNSLGLTITRALVSACGGTFELKPGATGGMVAQIVLPATRNRSGSVMRLLLCDDHRPLLDALSMALRDRGHTVVATALDPDEAVEAARRHQPDACLLDVNFRHANGLNAIGRILEVSPDTKVVMLSGSISRSLMAEAIAKGAQGFVGKEKPVGAIIEALEMAHHGHLTAALP